MKTQIFKTVLPLLAVVLLGVSLAPSCEKDKSEKTTPSSTEAFCGSWEVTKAYATDSNEVGLPINQGDTLLLNKTNHFKLINNQGNTIREGAWKYQNEQQILSLQYAPYELSLHVESINDNSMKTTVGRVVNTMEQAWWIVIFFKKLPSS